MSFSLPGHDEGAAVSTISAAARRQEYIGVCPIEFGIAWRFDAATATGLATRRFLASERPDRCGAAADRSDRFGFP
jgi:hypothetical protein